MSKRYVIGSGADRRVIEVPDAVSGPPGPEGPEGPAGIDGLDGEDGAPGPPGTTNHLELSNVGTKTHSQLDAAADASAAHAAAAAPHSGHATPASVDAAIATHAGAADPHATYQRESEKGAANGYAPLDGAGLVPLVNLPNLGGGGPWTVVKKLADEQVVNATLQNDDHLFFALAANTKYAIRLKVFFSTGATPDFKYRLVAEGAVVSLVRRWTDRIFGGATARAAVAVLTALDAADVALAGTGAEGWIAEDLIIHVGGTGGTFRFQWAQVTTNATPAIVRAGSYLEHMTIG